MTPKNDETTVSPIATCYLFIYNRFVVLMVLRVVTILDIGKILSIENQRKR